MNTSEPKVGAQYRLDGQIYEIISIEGSDIAMCSLIHQYRRFIERDLFASMEQKGKLLLHQRAPIDINPAARFASMPEPQQEKAHSHYAYALECLETLGGRLPRVAAKALIKRVASRIHDDNPPSLTSVWRWKKKLSDNNCNPLSLLRLAPKSRPKRLSACTESLIQHNIKTVYLQKERPSITHAYKLLKGHVAKENRDRLKYSSETIEIPSYATFRRRILQKDCYYVTQQREGTKAARKKNKFSGHLYIDDDPYSGTIFDSHKMNVYVKDHQTGVVGRPILSAHIVPATRENSGWDISLGAPCAEKMMRATIRAIIKNGKMAGVVADHGSEILNNWAITTFKTLGINPDYVPVGDPDAKAIIERFFGTVSSGFTNNLPGTTKGSPKARGDYPSEECACLTLEQLRTAYESWLEVYHSTWHEGLYTSPSQKKAQLSALAPPAERYTEEELKQLCVSRWYLKLDGGRVDTEHLTWFGAGIPEVRQKLKRNQKAVVYYNPCDLGTVWVAHPETPDDKHPAIAINPKYQNGLTLSDHKLVVEQLSREKRAFNENIALIKLFELNEYVEACRQANNKAKNKKNNSTKLPIIGGEVDTASPYVCSTGGFSVEDEDFGTLYTGVGDNDGTEH
jgi:putative transposase